MSRKTIKRQDPSVDAQPQVPRKKVARRSSAGKQPAATNQVGKGFAARNKIIAAFAIAMMMIATTAILAQRGKQKTPLAQNHTEQLQNTSQPAGEISPESLTSPSLWSKEYIHGPGGRVVATEERLKFTDVDDGSLYFEDIYRVAARGVTVGCPAPNYCPDGQVTRAQMAVFIERALGVFTPPAPATQHFTDVPPGYWAYDFVEDFVTRGITSGCTPPTSYCPEGMVTHAEMAVFVIKARGEQNPPTPPAQRFLDVPPGYWAYKFIDRMGALDIWQGCGSNNYCPEAAVTRRQMAHILVKAFGI